MDEREEIAAATGGLLARLTGPAGPPQRVTTAAGCRACLILVWDAAGPMPSLAAERLSRDRNGREQCRRDVLAVQAAHGRPLTKKHVVTAVRAAGHRHGPGTVAKALADLTASGDLVNPKDKRGHRLPAWDRPRLGLFDAG